MSDIYDVATDVMPVVPAPYAMQQNAVRLAPSPPIETPELFASSDLAHSQQRLSRGLIIVCIILTISQIVVFALLFWLVANTRFLS